MLSGHRPPQKQICIIVLVILIVVSLVASRTKHNSNNIFSDSLFKSKFHYSIHWLGEETLKVFAPQMIYQTRSKQASQTTKYTKTLLKIVSPLQSYIKEYGNKEIQTVSQQVVPVSYLENGGQDEESGYSQIDNTTTQPDVTEIDEQNKTNMAGKSEESTDKYKKSKKTKKNHTYSKLYTDRQLSSFSFVTSKLYSIDAITPVKKEDVNVKKLCSVDLSIADEGEAPKVLIYHTHASENFSDSRKGKKEDTVVGVGDVLADELERTYHIKVYHDREIYDMIHHRLDRSLAYQYAGKSIKQILEKYPSIEVVIDLHRDGIDEHTHLVSTIDGKPTAPIMLFDGMSRIKGKGEIKYLKNPNRETNLAFSMQLQLAGLDSYPTMMRKIFLRSYRFNLHYRGRSVLVEAGAQTNTVREVKNAMEPLAKILNQVLREK